MALVGPGAHKQQETSPEPLLSKASEFEYVTILNPLTDDFQVRVAQDVPVNMPFEVRDKTAMVQSERDITAQYGLGLKNPDHQAKKYIYNEAIIPAGRTMNFKGNEAQVVVTQLVNEILQREGRKRFLADPNVRLEVENRIVIARGSVQDILDRTLQTPSQQIATAIDNSNTVATEAPAFADLVTETESTDEQKPTQRRGRPPRAAGNTAS